MADLPEKLTYRVAEIAIFFDVTPRTVYIWIKQKKIPSVDTPGGGKRIPREAVTSLPVSNCT